MTVLEINGFFPPGVHIRNLPSLQNPRLYFSGETPIRRWKESAFYPAYRKRAMIYRFALRCKATMGIGGVTLNQAAHWPIKDFVQSVFPDVRSAVVLAGAPGPTQKITLQLWNKHGVLGYLKYAEKPAAVARLGKERYMLSALPLGLAPTLLKYGCMGDGVGLLQTAVLGKHVQATLPPPMGICRFLQTFTTSPPLKLEAHPWIILQLKHHGSFISRWVEALAHREWPVVFSHGDFVPWNIFSTKESNYLAIDWEYGTLEGFPYLDLAYYILQLGCLLYRWTPQSASDYAIRFLTDGADAGLTEQEAQALVALAAYYALQSSLEDGKNPSDSTQIWWKAVWETEP